jgi:hypothetical protein
MGFHTREMPQIANAILKLTHPIFFRQGSSKIFFSYQKPLVSDDFHCSPEFMLLRQ